MSPDERAARQSPAADNSRVAGRAVFDEALAVLRDRRGLDFSHYRRATIERRLTLRVHATCSAPEDYVDLIRRDERELDSLAAALTIKVSRFYRDAAVFDLLREQFLPALRSSFGGEPLRVWSAGCAEGEEAYTLAMLLGENDRVDATDIDGVALSRAARGIYGVQVFDEMPLEVLAPFVDGVPGTADLSVNDAVRTRVQFAQHDLGSGSPPAPGATYHLICCRNVLIYFSRPLQTRVIELLVQSLLPGGILCLGEAEWTLGHPSLEVLDRRLRLFRRVASEVNR